jgi:hypothetical protein
VKALLLGSAPAAALGLLLGGFARPELAVAPPPMQPVETSYAWALPEPPAYDAPASAAYVSRANWPGEPPAPPPDPEPVPAVDVYAYAYPADDAPEPPVAEDEPAEPSYPSIAGDILSGTERERSPAAEATSPEA